MTDVEWVADIPTRRDLRCQPSTLCDAMAVHKLIDESITQNNFRRDPASWKGVLLTSLNYFK